MKVPSANRALSGLRVLDMTQYESGAVCTQLLGWLGADVIKIEPPGVGDAGRRSGSPLQTGPEVAGLDAFYFLIHNSNKRSITIDLKNPRGRELFLEMAKHADVLIENLGPRSFERLDLGFDLLHSINPRLIVARIKGFGLEGPYSGYKSFDPISQAAGGLMSLTGPTGGEPMRAGPSVADSSSGVMCAVGILAAITHRAATGKGQQVEVSMQESVMNLIRGRYADYYKSDPHEPPKRLGNSLVRGVPSGLYKCKGGGVNDYVYLLTTPGGPEVWEGVCRAVGRDDLVGDPEYRTLDLRLKRRDEIEGFVSKWISEHTKYEVMEAFASRDVTCGAVLGLDDILNDPHLLARSAIVEYEHPVRGTMRLPGCPVRLSESPPTKMRPPLLGEHAQEILAELLGYGDDEVEELRRQRVI